MSYPVYTRQMYSAHAVDTDSFVVPDGYVWVATSVFVFFPGGEVAPGFQLVDHETNVTYLWGLQAISALGSSIVDGGYRLPWLEGTQIDVSGSGSPDITIAGYELQLP